MSGCAGDLDLVGHLENKITSEAPRSSALV